MQLTCMVCASAAVALRKESVDRNSRSIALLTRIPSSLSARRAWIEISPKLEIGLSSSVALRKENMDRNSRTAASTFSKTVALRKESMECFSF